MLDIVHLYDTIHSDADGWIIIWKMKTRRVILKWKAHEDSCMKVTTIEKHTLIRYGYTFHAVA